MLITETIDDVTFSVTEDGTLTVHCLEIPSITALALRLFLLPPDVDGILNELELVAGQIALNSRQITKGRRTARRPSTRNVHEREHNLPDPNAIDSELW